MVGAYTINNRIFDIWAILFFGVLGYILEKMDFSLAAVLLGFIIGPIIEENFCRGMQRSLNDFSKFFTASPIALVIYGVVLIIVISKVLKILFNKQKKESVN